VKKRKTVRARRKRKEMIKNFVNFLLSPNLVISYYIYQIRHLIIISALEIKQEEIDCVSSKKKSQSNARNARPIPIKNDRTSVTKRKKINPRDGVFSQTIKQKNESFLPPLKTDEKKKFPLKNRTKNSLHYSVLVSLS
jgi:hypothetical protein